MEQLYRDFEHLRDHFNPPSRLFLPVLCSLAVSYFDALKMMMKPL
tara:strand:- start:1076 stop:1210 length:135 start_codon:yes stop_codon:yes gene_type:complete